MVAVHEKLVQFVKTHDVRVVHTPDWQPDMATPACIDGIHTMSDCRLLAALERAAEVTGKVTLRGDAAHHSPAGSEDYMSGLAWWAGDALEVEDCACEVSAFRRAEHDAEATLWVTPQSPDWSCQVDDRATAWWDVLVVDRDHRLGRCIAAYDASGKGRVSKVKPGCTARVCWALSVVNDILVPAPMATCEHVDVAKVRPVAQVPVKAVSQVPVGKLRRVGVCAPGGLAAAGWTGNSLRQVCRLSPTVLLLGASEEEATALVADHAREPFEPVRRTMLPALLI